MQAATPIDRSQALKIARRRVGIAKFERECRLTTEMGRLKKAWRVPGTPEAGQWATLNRYVREETERLARGEPGIFVGKA